MTRLLDLGTLSDLQDVAADFQRRIEAADLAGCEPFIEWSQQILVDHPEQKALVLPVGTIVEGDLILDSDCEPFASGGVSCIVANDDFKVTGRILNADPEGGPSLLVAGNLESGDFFKAASGIVVIGSLTAAGLVVCAGDNGALLVGGNLNARALIDCDHEIIVIGDVHATVASDDLGNMRTLLVPEVFDEPEDPSDEWPDGDLIRERLLEGLPILKG
jgi:hypothetical protein